jgi:hypothetical protein
MTESTPPPVFPQPTRNQPLVFPPGLVDRRGLRLRPGSAVDVVAGVHLGHRGEVVGWLGDNGLQVLTDDDESVAVSPFDLERTDRSIEFSATMHRDVEEIDAPSTLLVITVGTHDLALADGVDPASVGLTERPDEPGTARQWTSICAQLAADVPADERTAWVANRFDAPIVGRVLREAALGPVIDRLCFVVTDQDPPHDDDTFAMADLLALWVEGTSALRQRDICEITDPIVLTHAPHVLDAVVHFVEPALRQRSVGVQRLAVERTGGTPAMGFGTLLAAMAAVGPNQVVRDIDVPRDQPLIEMDVADGHVFAGLRRSVDR